MSRFDILSKDEIFTIALMLDLPDILSFCRLSKKFNNSVCNNNYFWIKRMKQDYGKIYLTISPDKKVGAKKYYEFLNTKQIRFHNKGIDVNPYAAAHKIVYQGITVPNPNNPGGVISDIINDQWFAELNKIIGLDVITDIRSDVLKQFKS